MLGAGCSTRVELSLSVGTRQHTSRYASDVDLCLLCRPRSTLTDSHGAVADRAAFPVEHVMATRGKNKANIEEVGGKRLTSATQMMGHGYDPFLSEGALKPPIFLTSTFAFESAAAGKRFFEHITGKRQGPADGLVYSRFNGPNQEIVEDRLALRAALDFEEESAGRLMQREFFASPAFWTVGQIIDRMRSAEELPDRFYEVFVVDPAFKPVGSVPLSTLLKAPRETVIESIMTSRDMRPVPATMDQEEVAYLFEQYNLISAPVIDDADRLIGMITVDDVVEMVREETHEDMLALGGVEADTGLSDSVFETVRSRFSWLAVNLATAILASLVIAMFDAAIGQIVALAVLMPIVASMGGNAGTQTLTVVVRALATKDLTAANAARVVFREALVGFVNGVIFAMIMGALAALWYFMSGWGSEDDAVRLGVVVGVAMIINLLAAGLAGILVPISLQRAGADPAVSSAVFVTTVTDIVGFFVFLGLAAAVLLPAAA